MSILKLSLICSTVLNNSTYYFWFYICFYDYWMNAYLSYFLGQEKKLNMFLAQKILAQFIQSKIQIMPIFKELATSCLPITPLLPCLHSAHFCCLYSNAKGHQLVLGHSRQSYIIGYFPWLIP